MGYSCCELPDGFEFLLFELVLQELLLDGYVLSYEVTVFVLVDTGAANQTVVPEDLILCF